jgi:hypothetical protein
MVMQRSMRLTFDHEKQPDGRGKLSKCCAKKTKVSLMGDDPEKDIHNAFSRVAVPKRRDTPRLFLTR